MDKLLRSHADQIIRASIDAVLPDEAVKKALAGQVFSGKVYLVSAGKAAWQMAKAAWEILGSRIYKGVVVTKYGHCMEPIGDFACYEGGHPVPDENAFRGTQAALDMTASLNADDTVLFLLSGGGSALFEKPRISGEELQDITGQLLASGADIVQINTIRKRLSAVKGGRFAQHCAPAQVFSVVLSDVIGDRLDMIASGPACPDLSTSAEAIAIARACGLSLSEKAWSRLEEETPKTLNNVTTKITGSVRQLCKAAAEACQDLGYTPVMLTDSLNCQARDAGRMLAEKLRENTGAGKSIAFIAGGETVVKVTGKGKGGRNQEIALAAAIGIADLTGAAVFSIGSDGTDGPTDAAGGYVDYDTAAVLQRSVDISAVLADNDAYHALEKVNGLIFTGPTGTNVNDVAVALLKE